jgi:hypothetical protein
LAAVAKQLAMHWPLLRDCLQISFCCISELQIEVRCFSVSTAVYCWQAHSAVYFIFNNVLPEDGPVGPKQPHKRGEKEVLKSAQCSRFHFS